MCFTCAWLHHLCFFVYLASVSPFVFVGLSVFLISLRVPVLCSKPEFIPCPVSCVLCSLSMYLFSEFLVFGFCAELSGFHLVLLLSTFSLARPGLRPADLLVVTLFLLYFVHSHLPFLNKHFFVYFDVLHLGQHPQHPDSFSRLHQLFCIMISMECKEVI